MIHILSYELFEAEIPEKEYTDKAIRLMQDAVKSGELNAQNVKAVLDAVRPNKAWFRKKKNQSFQTAFHEYIKGVKFKNTPEAIKAWNIKKNEINRG